MVGCEFTGLRADVNEHVQSVMNAHLADMAKAFRTSEQARNREMSDMRQSISNLWRSVQSSGHRSHVCNRPYPL